MKSTKKSLVYFFDKCALRFYGIGKIILFCGIIFCSCAKEDEEETKILKISDSRLTNIWVCEKVESNLLGADKEINDFINGKLNNFVPHTTINKDGAFGLCWFMYPDGPQYKFAKQLSFDIQDDLYIKFSYPKPVPIIPNKEGTESFSASGVIKNGKLYLTFLRNDFEIFTWLIGEDYPYNKSLIDETTTGDVTLIYNPVYPIGNE